MRKFRSVISVLIAAVMAVISAGAATAGQPPPGYPTAEVMVTANHATLGPIPLHRGFWDSDTDQGFGVDKAWNKHNIWSVEAMRKLMVSPNWSKQTNGNYAMRGYAYLIDCQGGSCRKTDERELIGVHDGRSYGDWYGWPVGGLMGMRTAYCQNPGGAWACPDWVTYSILNPGADNPFKTRAFGSAAGTEELLGEALPGSEASAPPADPTDKARIKKKLDGPEIKGLREKIANGKAKVKFSYTPLDESALTH